MQVSTSTNFEDHTVEVKCSAKDTRIHALAYPGFHPAGQPCTFTFVIQTGELVGQTCAMYEPSRSAALVLAQAAYVYAMHTFMRRAGQTERAQEIKTCLEVVAANQGIAASAIELPDYPSRRRYNFVSAWVPESYRTFLNELSAELGVPRGVLLADLIARGTRMLDEALMGHPEPSKALPVMRRRAGGCAVSTELTHETNRRLNQVCGLSHRSRSMIVRACIRWGIKHAPTSASDLTK